jgi:hypothetical protein
MNTLALMDIIVTEVAINVSCCDTTRTMQDIPNHTMIPDPMVYYFCIRLPIILERPNLGVKSRPSSCSYTLSARIIQ